MFFILIVIYLVSVCQSCKLSTFKLYVDIYASNKMCAKKWNSTGLYAIKMYKILSEMIVEEVYIYITNTLLLHKIYTYLHKNIYLVHLKIVNKPLAL